MKKLLFLWVSIMLSITLSYGQNATNYQLSNRTYEQLQVLEDKIENAQIMSAILSIAIFTTVFDEDSAVQTIVNIGTSDWVQFAKAANGLNTFVKTNLEKFCELEAFHQRKSRDDFKFWQKMAKSFQ